jgi:hypothetical protein
VVAALGLEPHELGLDLAIAGDNLLVVLHQLEGLSERKEVPRAPGAFQRAGDRLGVGLAVGSRRAAAY